MSRYDRIKALCKQKGVTITGTEKELGFARGSLSKIDKSEPSSERVQKLADYLNSTERYILTGEKESNENDLIIAQNDNEKRLLISFRNAGNLTSDQMDELETLFSQSMDLYLKAKGLKK